MATFLKMSESASLAFHAMAVLARHPEHRISGPELADELGISPHTLGKVMTQLARVGLVEGARGPSGGFYLARTAAEISLMEIQEAVDGPFLDTSCLLRRPVCKGGVCIISSLIEQLSRQARDLFEGTSLQALAGTVEIGDARWALEPCGPEPVPGRQNSDSASRPVRVQEAR